MRPFGILQHFFKRQVALPMLQSNAISVAPSYSLLSLQLPIAAFFLEVVGFLAVLSS